MPVHASTLALTIVIAFVYLVVIRLVDLNEKEPLWAVGMLFGFGALAACVQRLLMPGLIDLNVIAFTNELARFVAIAAGVGVLTALALRRGWSEINGLTDGVVYGVAGGLGYATGEAFIEDLLVGPLPTVVGMRGAASVGTIALRGLADGVFGALIGIGFAAAIYARSPLRRVLYPVMGYAAAVSAHAGWEHLRHGNPLAGGTESLLRAWLALVLPVIVVGGVMAIALAREKRAIRQELPAEAAGGAVSPEDLELLESVFRRDLAYLKALFRGQLGRVRALRGLHNRQVQLALAKYRVSQHGEPVAAQPRDGEVEQLRAAVLALKGAMASADQPAPAVPGPPASSEARAADEADPKATDSGSPQPGGGA